MAFGVLKDFVEWLWEERAIFAGLVQSRHPDETVACLEDLSRVLGKHWAYHHRDMIMSFL